MFIIYRNTIVTPNILAKMNKVKEIVPAWAAKNLECQNFPESDLPDLTTKLRVWKKTELIILSPKTKHTRYFDLQYFKGPRQITGKLIP